MTLRSLVDILGLLYVHEGPHHRLDDRRRARQWNVTGFAYGLFRDGSLWWIALCWSGSPRRGNRRGDQNPDTYWLRGWALSIGHGPLI